MFIDNVDDVKVPPTLEMATSTFNPVIVVTKRAETMSLPKKGNSKEINVVIEEADTKIKVVHTKEN